MTTAGRQLGWPHLVIAVIVGVSLGAAAYAAPRIGTAADAPAAALEALASDYLGAIAAGDSDRASELAPLGVGRTPAAQPMLASAWRIHPLGTGPAQIDGDAGAVEVRYRVGGTEVARQLRASLRAGMWRLETSLAEAPDTSSNDPSAVLRIAGVELPRRDDVYLYPAVYRLDTVEGPLFTTAGGSFAIDGDPETETRVRVTTGLMASFQERLVALAGAAMHACTARPACPVRAQAAFEQAGAAVVLETFGDGRMLDVKVPLLARQGSVWEWRDVVVRVELDSRGLPVGWRCSILGDVAGAVPCGA